MHEPNVFPGLYQRFQPNPLLTPYIEGYYLVQIERGFRLTSERMFSDLCVHMTFNLTGDIHDPKRDILIEPGITYLAGPKSDFCDIQFTPKVKMFSIRFKPGGLSAFCDIPLHQYTDRVMEAPMQFPHVTLLPRSKLATSVDKLLLSLLSKPTFNVDPILRKIYKSHGNIEIGSLAEKHFISERNLIRLFKRKIGITPKLFSKIVRLKHALTKIKNRDSKTSLLEIAFNCGYYDHAHLTREVKKYTGLVPSQL